MQTRARTAVVLVSLTLVAAACGGDAVTSTTTGADPTDPAASLRPPAATPEGAPEETPEILAFEAPLLDGGVFRGADLAGTDVAFWFWAPW